MTSPPAAADAGSRQPILRPSRRLTAEYDVALVDLDGVVVLGDHAIPRAAEALARARADGMRVAYVTNNASRRPGDVVAALQTMAIPAEPVDVVTSAQATAHLLRVRLKPGSRVLVVGSDALAEEIRAAGFAVVDTAEDDPAAVVQGIAADLTWRDLAEATVAIHRGALWVAANTDSTFPSPRGPLPGNGALVAAVGLATGTEPEVVGKPQPELHRECVRRTHAKRPLVVGDRLDTDIAGAVAVGADSLLVLSGVTTPAQLLSAPAGHRPTYVGRDLCALVEPHPMVQLAGDAARCNGFTARSVGSPQDDADLVLSGAGPDTLDALRALCAAAWHVTYPTGVVRSDGEAASTALRQLRIGPAPRTR